MRKSLLFLFLLLPLWLTAQEVRWQWLTPLGSGTGSISAADSGVFIVWRGSDTLRLVWKAQPVTPPPVDTVVNVQPGVLTYDAATRRFTAPDGNTYPDVRGAGVEWSRVGDTAAWRKFSVPIDATAAQINTLITQADAAQPGAVLLFQAGTYNLSGQILGTAITNVIFRGAGKDQTFFNFAPITATGAYFRLQDRTNTARHQALDLKAWADTVRFTNADWTRHGSRYAVGRYVYLTSSVPAEWAGQYNLWYRNQREWAHGLARITEVNLKENWLRIAQPFPVELPAVRIQPIEPSEFVGVEGITITTPAVASTVTLHTLQSVRCANVWFHSVDIRNPSNWPLDFNRLVQGEQKYIRVSKNQHLGLGGGRGYGGVLGSRLVLVDSVRYDEQRHALLTSGGQAQSVFRRIHATKADAHLPHHVWEFSNLYEDMLISKAGDFQPQQLYVGNSPANIQLYGGMIGSAIYKSRFIDPSNPRFNGRCIFIGMSQNFVISHSIFESSLFHDARSNAMIHVFDMTQGTISDSRFIYRPEWTQSPGREALIDILPGTVKNGEAIVQTGNQTYPALDQFGTEFPPVPSRSRITLRNIDVVNIASDRWYRGYGDVKPDATNVRVSTNASTEAPRGIPGIPSIYEAQLKHR